MNGEINRKILHAAMLRIGTVFLSSICALDTVIRIEDDEKKLFDCRYCVFKDVVKMLVCPNEIREDIEDVLKLSIDEETYACENCALVDTVSGSIGCPLIIKENLKGVK